MSRRRQTLSNRLGVALLSAALGALAFFDLSSAQDKSGPPAPDGPGTSATSGLFTDVAQEAGVRFVHFNGMTGQYYYPEIVGAGAALFDYDNDGDLDLFLVQGNLLTSKASARDAIIPPQGPLPLKCRLYRNDLTVQPDGTRRLHFTDVTERSGIDAHVYGMGIAVGDYNNDGWPDLYITSFGANQLFKNNGDGTFTDVTAASRTAENRWGVSASFFDYDRDGWLDLFVGNYVNFGIINQKLCFGVTTARDYCGPLAYEPLPNKLFHNRGDGTFEDVTLKSQIAREYNGALGAIAADFDGDGWPDLFVANDGRPNELWMNQKNGTFRNDALLAGCALGQDGNAKAGMGVDAGDFDNDGDEDLILTQLKDEKCTLYVNNGKGWFEERTPQAGLGTATLPYTGFGTVWFDYDNDGWLDIMMANGEVKGVPELVRAKKPYPLGQPNLLFHNLRNGRFENVTAAAGSVFSLAEVSRGVAVGDLDNDGYPDLVVTNNSGPVRILRNNAGFQHHWVGLRLLGDKGMRDMIGARVRLIRGDGLSLWRRVRTDGSYACARDPRLLFGLGASTSVRIAHVYWPDGREEEWSTIPVDRYTALRQGTGKPVR